jgi:serine/threonine kinase PknH
VPSSAGYDLWTGELGYAIRASCPRPSALRPGIPPALDEVIARGMAKNPDDRYPSAGELARAAAAAVAGSGGHDLTAPTNISAAADRATDVTRGGAPAPWGQPEKPTGTGKLAAGARRHWKPLTAVAVVIIAAAGVGIWAATRPGPAAPTAAPSTPTAESKSVAHPTPTPTSTPASNLTAADVDLLKVMPEVGYSRANCTHMNPFMGADAALNCDKNPTVGAPPARFFHFPTTDALTDAYKAFTTSLHTTNCPGDPPGTDGPWSTNGKEIGRQACYMDNTVTPAAASTLVATNNPAVLEIFNWTDPGGMDALRNWWRQGGATVQNAPGTDPDFYTPADLDLLKQLGGTPYGKANCRHNDPAPPATAWLGCTYNLTAGAPAAAFFKFSDREVTLSWYDAVVKQFAPRRCGGAPGGSDDAWLDRDGKHLGRYTCFADATQNNLPALVAVSTESVFLGAQFTAEPADSHYQLPKTEQELANWFTNKFRV